METAFFFSSIPPFADDSGDEEPASQSDKSELHGTLKTLSSKLEDLSTCNDLIAKHGAALQRSLSELENLKLPAESGEKIKAVNERATLFRITSNAMINVSVAAFARRQREMHLLLLFFYCPSLSHSPISSPIPQLRVVVSMVTTLRVLGRSFVESLQHACWASCPKSGCEAWYIQRLGRRGLSGPFLGVAFRPAQQFRACCGFRPPSPCCLHLC